MRDGRPIRPEPELVDHHARHPDRVRRPRHRADRLRRRPGEGRRTGAAVGRDGSRVLVLVAVPRIVERFEVSDRRDGKGDVHVTLNHDARIAACSFMGTDDLGDFRADFENIRSVEFVR